MWKFLSLRQNFEPQKCSEWNSWFYSSLRVGIFGGHLKKQKQKLWSSVHDTQLSCTVGPIFQSQLFKGVPLHPNLETIPRKHSVITVNVLLTSKHEKEEDNCKNKKSRKKLKPSCGILAAVLVFNPSCPPLPPTLYKAHPSASASLYPLRKGQKEYMRV